MAGILKLCTCRDETWGHTTTSSPNMWFMLLGNIRGPIRDETNHFWRAGIAGIEFTLFDGVSVFDGGFLHGGSWMGRGMATWVGDTVYDTINVDIDIGSIFQTRDKTSPIYRFNDIYPEPRFRHSNISSQVHRRQIYSEHNQKAPMQLHTSNRLPLTYLIYLH